MSVKTKTAPVRRHNFTLTDGEKQELRMAFNLFDKNGGGTIEPFEVRVALRALGFNPTMDELNALIEKVDTEGTRTSRKDGVTFNEFTQIILEKISEPQPHNQLIRSFNNLDIDMDENVSLDDLTQVAQDLGEDLSPDELGEIIMTVRGCASEFDIHTKDVGAISQAQFVSAINKSLEL